MQTLLKLLAATLAVLSLASAAQAFDQKTKWYSINVETPPNGAPLFLTNTSDGVRWQPYRSNDPAQMWAIVWPDYPNAPAVEGLDVGDVHSYTSGGLPTHIVNRASGGCLTVSGSTATSTACQSNARRQVWEMFGKGPAKGIMTPSLGGLVAVSGRYDPANLAAGVTKDSGGAPWIYKFYLQMSAELTCSTNWSWNLCFVQGQ